MKAVILILSIFVYALLIALFALGVAIFALQIPVILRVVWGGLTIALSITAGLAYAGLLYDKLN